jgi:uncharacterized protein (UPF0548 family)
MLEDEARKSKVRRRWGIHPILKSREEEGEFHTLYYKLRRHPEKFKEYFRMDLDSFDKLYELIKHDSRITKSVTNFRNPLSGIQRLSICLR